jgi:hypothetical protein
VACARPVAAVLGLPDALLEAVRVGAAVEPDDPAERAAAAAVAELLATGDLTDDTWSGPAPSSSSGSRRRWS